VAESEEESLTRKIWLEGGSILNTTSYPDFDLLLEQIHQCKEQKRLLVLCYEDGRQKALNPEHIICIEEDLKK